MKPSEMRTKRRNLTERQLRRRQEMPVDFATGVKNLLSTKEVFFGKNSRTIRKKDKVIIEISNEDLGTITAKDLESYINVHKSPLFKFKPTVDALYDLIPSRRKMYHFALFMNNIGHYSGGRYYLVQIAYMLAEMGHKVTIISDNKSFFLNDFRFFDVGNRVEWITEQKCTKTKWFLNNPNNEFDFIIQSPLAPGGFLYAEKWNIPTFACLFESPNYVSQWRDGSDSTEEYWARYKNGIIRQANSLVCLSKEALHWSKEWLKGEYKGKFDIVSPCINTVIADRVLAPAIENEIVFVGRHVDFKNPLDIISSIAKLPSDIRPIVNYVGSHSSKLREKMINAANVSKVDIRFYANITDEEKFHIIKRSKLMVFLSVFEGFGIPPSEALYCEKPVIAYDIPVLRKEYGDAIDYIDIGDFSAVSAKVEYYLRDDAERIEKGLKGREAFFAKENPIPTLPIYMKKALRSAIYKKDMSITAGMIVLNGADTIKIALASIYDYVDKIIIVEGAVEDYAKNNPDMVNKPCGIDGSDNLFNSVDDTIKIWNDFKRYHDPFDKLEIIPHPSKRYWKNKNEMQNAIAEQVDTDLYLKVDADEIFTECDVEYMKRHFITDKDLYCIQILKHEFWKGLDTVACGGQWERPQARMWRWRKDFRHKLDAKTGFNYFVDENGTEVRNPSYKTLNLLEPLCYHLGYARDEKQIMAKINYYKHRGIESNVIDNFSNWKQGQPTNSTHPTGTSAKPFTGVLPLVLNENFFDSISANPKEKVENNINIMHSPPKHNLKKGSK